MSIIFGLSSNQMVVVDVHTIAVYSWTSRLSQLAWSKGRQPPDAVLRLSQ